MPFASRAQQRLFYGKPELRQYAAEFSEHTDFKNLPEHVKVKKKERVQEKVASLSKFARAYMEGFLENL